jgi:hypothetical protein
MRSKQLGQLLLENGDVKAEQIAQALKTQEQQGGLLGQVLQRMGACSAQAIQAALLKQVQVTDIRCADLAVPPEIAELVPRELCEAERLCPFERLAGLVCVVMGNPLNRRAITQIEEKTRAKVKSFKAAWPQISELIERTYGGGGAPVEAAPESGEALPVEMDLAPADVPVEAVAEPAPVEEPVAPVAIQPSAYQPSPVTGSGLRRQQPAAQPQEPTIKGIDQLDESRAEVIETTGRGLRQQERRPVGPAKVKPEKKAKVNVDLDALDLSGGEVVPVEGEAPRDMQELAPVATPPVDQRVAAAGLKQFSQVHDGYFYVGGKAPAGSRLQELSDLIDSLPVAETVAASIGEYEASQKPGAPAVKKPRPIELETAPATAMKAVPLSDAEFNKLVAGLDADPVGEWHWEFAAPGPVAAVAYEEN